MRGLILALALFSMACSSADSGSEAQFAREQIVREIDAGGPPVGVLTTAPVSVEDALPGLRALDLDGVTDGAMAVTEYEGFLLCSWESIEDAFWGQRGYAIRQETGEVYQWSLW